MCLAQEVDGIKKEILANGPVLGMLHPYTDLLTYKEGIYQRTADAFRFQGNHVVKVVGWDSSADGGAYWIVQNTWGTDWGEDGYAKIGSNGETTLDFYALSFAVYPKTLAEYQADEAAQRQQAEEMQNGDELENDIDQIFLDQEEDTSASFEEGIDQEL